MPKKFTPSVAQKARVDRFIEKWQPLLFLNQWNIRRNWSEVPATDEACVAEIMADCTYHECTITFYPKYFDKADSTQENCLVHELCHCLTMPAKDVAHKALVQEKHVMWHQFKEADERTTTHVANALFALEWHMREQIEALEKQVKNGKRKQ